MNGVFTEIELKYSKLTKSEKKVADFILHTPEQVLYTSITDLAELCGVGDSTVFRFCKSLNLNGYQDFKMLLAQDIANQKGTSHAIVGTINPEDDVQAICEKALSRNITALNETFQVLDSNNISKAVELISRAKRIHFFGVGSSGVIALDAKHKFMRILPNVEYVSDSHMQCMAASLLDNRDLAIIISYSGSTKDMLEVHKLAKVNDCKTICITRFAKSPLTQNADVVLLTGSNEGPLEGGASSTSIVQLYVLEVLYLQYFMEHYNKSIENKAITTEAISSKLL